MCAHVRTLLGILTLRVESLNGWGSNNRAGGLYDTRLLRGNTRHASTMKRINAKGEVFQQTSIYIRENVYLLAKEASIPMSEAAEQGVIAALHARGVEV